MQQAGRDGTSAIWRRKIQTWRRISGVMEFTVLCLHFALVSEVSVLSDRHQPESVEEKADAMGALRGKQVSQAASGFTNTSPLAAVNQVCPN